MKKWLIGLMCVGMFATAAMGDLSSPATLPIAWAGETGFTIAAIDALTGWDATGLSAPYANSTKFDGTGDKIIIYLDGAPGSLVCTARRSDSSALAGPYSATIEESADNATWSPVRTFDGSELNGTPAEFTDTLQSSTRYVKFEYVTKPTGQNFGVGSVQISSGGPAVFSVNLDKQNGFTVDQGSSDTITATAQNGTETYNYTWGTTMADGDYTAVGNVFTILDTAALGNDYTATVTATDSSDPQQQAEKAVTFSVVAPAVKYGIAITPPVNGTVTTTPATEAEAGATVTINATPAGGYAVGTKTVVGDDSTPITVTGNNFTMPTQPVTVTVAFVEASASRIIISQYTETETGTIPKGIEIWNVSGSDITFDAAGNLLDVKVAANGTNVPSSQVTASSGTLAAGSVWVIGTTNMTPDLVEPFAFNGDDAIVLELGGVLQDVIGTVGVDPGTAWTNNGVSTANQNIQLKSGITVGDVDGWTDPSERFEYVAAGSDLTGFGIAPGGSATFSVNVDKANGFTVEQGTSAAITATAQNGTETYNYTWGTTMAVGDYTAVGNVFTILDTAPIGDYSAEVVATDSSDPVQSVTNSLNFSVVAPPTKYAMSIVTNNVGEGTVTTTPATEAAAGAVVTVNASPVGGYAVQSIVVVDAGMNPVTVTGNSFTMPAAAVTVTVTFQEASASGELIISQYYEGASNNKWIEIYNPGAVAIDLAAGGYRIGLWANANREAWKTGTAPSSSTALSNSVPAGGTYLIKNSSAALPAYAVADITSGAMTFTGDDSVVLYTGSTYSYANVVDAFGMTGTNAMDKSFVRKIAVTTGVNTDFNAADWDEFTNAQVDGAAESTNERLGYHSTGAAVFSVSLNRSNGFTVEQGASDSITATAANGTAPYGYSWSSTLGGAYYSANSNVFTILATAPVGDYSATVTATDDAAQTASNSVTFSVTAPVVKYGIAIVTNAPANGTVTTTPATDAAAGATVTVNATPAGGYAVQSIVVVDAGLNPVTVTGNTFTMPASAVTVTVTFMEASASGELIISQYYEGTSNNKWIEIYNPGSSAVDLAAGGYRLGTWNNTAREGWKTNGAPTLAIVLSNSIAAGATYLVGHGSATNPVYAVANQTAGFAYNGDDSIVLYTGATFASANVVDALGMTASNGVDRSFVRKSSVTEGVNTDFNAADWDEFTLTQVEDAADATNERLGFHSTGAPALSVSVNRTNGFTVEQGQSDAITATAANGTGPYAYAWASTLGASYRTTNGNVFTILATAPTGSYSATVTATDATLATAQKTVTFSVVGLGPGPAVIIAGSRTGTVGVPMELTISVTNETAEEWFVDLKDPTGADAGWDYANFPPTFSMTPTMTGTYVLVVTAQTGSGNVTNTANLVIGAGDGGEHPSIPAITFVAGTGFNFPLPDGHTVSRMEAAGTATDANGEFIWSAFTDYTVDGSTVTINSAGAAARMIRVWFN